MSVAIPIPLLQHLPDVNVTPGVGVDEYALTYDNDTAKFVLRAPFAGLLATGATTGATAQAQAFTVGISLADTTTATSGVIFKGADRFIHNFHHPTGQTAAPDGRNTFVGLEAGNFTSGATATSTAHASDNTGVGYQVLTALSTGLRNIAVGSLALKAVTTGDGNCALGYYALLSVTTGSYNMAVGPWSLQNTTGSSNVAVGVEAGNRNTTGANNIFIGTSAAQFHANGSTALTDPENSIYLGFQTRGKDNSDSNSIVIGYAAIGLGANTTVIGNTSTTLTALPGGALRLTEMVAPTGSANNATIYTRDSGAGKTLLCCKLGDDVEIVIATQA